MRADLLELADVVVHLGRRRHHGPDLRDLRLADVQEAGSDRRGQPLMQAGAVIVAVELVAREGEMRVRMRAVDDDFDPARPSQLGDRLYRGDLAGEIRDVTDVD